MPATVYGPCLSATALSWREIPGVVEIGGTWWDGLRGISATKAAALEAFLRGRAGTLGTLPSIYKNDEDAEQAETESQKESPVSPWMPGHASARQDGSNGPAPVRLIHRNTNTVH
ncbi:hypothetical protein F7R26_033950 [Cupriavidus basilensis]|uniref:Uncharacterized protein n=1 Tax=Cupriavidus basilensis TaxID=68895 RepID=A0A643FI20_9BURK|nr:hypothetical protein F7R26_033950 [Cupriavidus basilensis]